MTTRRIGGWTFAAGMLVVGAGLAVAETVEVGVSRDEVIARLGEPTGAATMRGVEVLYYPRGQVDLRDGKVIRSSVLSEAEFEARRQQLEEAAAARRQAAAEAAARRQQEGQARLAEIDENDALAGQSAAQRQAYWRQFQRQYPEVDVRSRLAEAQGELDRQAAADAAFERRVQEELAKPVPGLSSRQLRKFRRGRSPSAVAAREAAVREQLGQEMGRTP